MRTRLLVLAPLVALGLSACGDEPSDKGTSSASTSPNSTNPPPRPPPNVGGQPQHIEVDHILIGVARADAPRGFMGRHSEADARALTKDLVDRLRAGTADWDAAKRQFSEDGVPGHPGGPYGMANDGVAASPGEAERGQMATSFGDVGFSLKVGEIGVAEFDRAKSPFGFHIIKRTK